MMNNLLNVIVLGSLVGTFVVFAPEPGPRPAASRPLAVNVAAAPPVVATPPTLSSQQPPIPLVRSRHPSVVTVAAPVVQPAEATSPMQDAVSRSAAKTAIEADGYKDVTALAKAADGTWRAKAHRGQTEVQLTVDGAGRVSTE